MSHNTFGAYFDESETQPLVQEEEKTSIDTYGRMAMEETGYRGQSQGVYASGEYAASRGAPVRESANGVAPSSEKAMLQKVALALVNATKNPNLAGSDDLMSENNALTTILTYRFRWMHPQKSDSVSRSNSNSNDQNAPNTVPVPSQPAVVKFTHAQLSKAFRKKMDPTDRQYVLAMDLVSMSNTAPYDVAFTMHNIQGETLEREFEGNDGRTIMIPAGSMLQTTEKYPLYELTDVTSEDLREHGHVSLEDELHDLSVLPGIPTDRGEKIYIVQADTLTARFLKQNQGTMELEPVWLNDENGKQYAKFKQGRLTSLRTPFGNKIVQVYLVPEHELTRMHDDYKAVVVEKMQSTDFLSHTAVLTRADRDSKEGSRSRFADATDAPVMSKATIERHNNTIQEATVRIRFRVVDPALIAGEKKD